MSKLSNDIKTYVTGDYLTGEEYGKWGCLNRTQRKDINKLCELCDMFEKSADNFYKENLQKDQRIAELEKENKRLNTKLEIWNRFDKKDYIHRGEKVTERDYYYYTNGVSAVLENEVEQLKHELEELKKNAIVPKFKKGQNIYFFEKFNNEVIKGEIDMFDYYTERYLVFINDNFGSDWYLEEELYAIKKEALKKLEEV